MTLPAVLAILYEAVSQSLSQYVHTSPEIVRGIEAGLRARAEGKIITLGQFKSELGLR